MKRSFKNLSVVSKMKLFTFLLLHIPIIYAHHIKNLLERHLRFFLKDLNKEIKLDMT